MRLIATKNTVILATERERIHLVTLQSPEQAMRALKWTRKYGTAAEGAGALLNYCKDKGLKPKGRAITKKRCTELAGMKANYKIK